MQYEAYNEIHQQSDSLQQTAAAVAAMAPDITGFFGNGDYDEIVFIGCGSSYWLSQSAAHVFAEKLKVRSTAVNAGDVLLNPQLYENYSKPLLVIPSRSGSTTETIKAVDFYKNRYGCPVMAVVIYPDSALAQRSDLSIELPWANEVSVCQTRSFNNLYAACVLAAAYAGGDEKLPAAMVRFSANVNNVAANISVNVRNILKQWKKVPRLAVLAHGKLAGSGHEGAYIVMEMAQHAAHFFATLELRHGPMVLLNEEWLVLLVSNGQHHKAEEKLVEEINTHKARVVVVSPELVFGNAFETWTLGEQVPEEVLGLSFSQVTQVLAYELAILKNLNPDTPKDLVRWIALVE